MRSKKANQTRKPKYRISTTTAAGNTVVKATAATLAGIQAKARGKIKPPFVIEQLHLGEIDTDEYMARGAKRPHWSTIYTAPAPLAGRLPNPATGKWQVEGVYGHPGGAYLSRDKAMAAAKKIANDVKAKISIYSPNGAEIEVTPDKRGPRTPNPGIPQSTKPLVTDRALRYRAAKNPPEGPEICAYCGADAGRVDIEHVDGHEENTAPENLLYACRPCNVQKGLAFKEEGIGRPTRQYNPKARGLEAAREALNRAYGKLDALQLTNRPQGEKAAREQLRQVTAIREQIEALQTTAAKLKRTKNPARPAAAATLTDWKAAVSSLMGMGPWAPAAAVKTVQRTPHAKRAAFARQLGTRRTKNPGAASSGAYFSAIQILRGQVAGDASKARALIDATPHSSRSQWTRASWRTRKEVYGPSGRAQRSFDDAVPF